MTTRDHAPLGAPCWTDLWTSDVDGSRRFYCELFGWDAQEPSPEFGGYFMFTRDGLPVAGGMGDMDDMRADNSWKIYLDTPDIAKTVASARAKGAEVIGEPGEVADLGIQAVLVDPTGAGVGAWQPGTFPGFIVLNEHGAPSWFELHTRDFATAIDFYESVFQWRMEPVGDTDEFRYSTLLNPDGGDMSAGIMDAKSFLPDGVPAHWSVYWEVDDASAAVAKVKSLGGSVVQDVEDTPYGRLATVTDPAGAQFKFRQANAAGA
jgi:predicted enzyme related to lactoylglutathione lyase